MKHLENLRYGDLGWKNVRLDYKLLALVKDLIRLCLTIQLKVELPVLKITVLMLNSIQHQLNKTHFPENHQISEKSILKKNNFEEGFSNSWR